jgi:hypothetical protein
VVARAPGYYPSPRWGYQSQRSIGFHHLRLATFRRDHQHRQFLVVLNDVPPTPPQAITAKSEFEEEE